jgi:hypothetical protein
MPFPCSSRRNEFTRPGIEGNLGGQKPPGGSIAAPPERRRIDDAPRPGRFLERTEERFVRERTNARRRQESRPGVAVAIIGTLFVQHFVSAFDRPSATGLSSPPATTSACLSFLLVKSATAFWGRSWHKPADSREHDCRLITTRHWLLPAPGPPGFPNPRPPHLTAGASCDSVPVLPHVFSQWGNGKVVLWKLVTKARSCRAGVAFSVAAADRDIIAQTTNMRDAHARRRSGHQPTAFWSCAGFASTTAVPFRCFRAIPFRIQHEAV